MSLQLIKSDYNGVNISFTEDGWFNATEVAAKYSKDVVAWLRQRETAEYMAALFMHLHNGDCGFLTQLNNISKLDGSTSASRSKMLGLVKSTGFVKTKAGSPLNGGGTWLHPKLAVAFSRWLDIRFGIWCDLEIDSILRNKHPHFDKKKLRHATASTNKVMNAILEYTRHDQGKSTDSKHYMCEAKLVNWALTGEFKGLDRDRLSADEISALAQLEQRNTVLIGRNLDYETRKTILHQLALDIKAGPLRLAA